MGSVIKFPEIKSITSDHSASKEILLEEWIARNRLISEEFHKHSAYQKQQTLDTVLGMCDELYGMCLELKTKLKEIKQ